jgi:hypothetical protein
MCSAVGALRSLNMKEFHLFKLTVSVNGVARHDSNVY